MTQTLNIVERLLAHAKLYQRMADEAWNEELAAQLRRKAHECVTAAARCPAGNVFESPRSDEAAIDSAL